MGEIKEDAEILEGTVFRCLHIVVGYQTLTVLNQTILSLSVR
jgi:hypothetical protein